MMMLDQANKRAFYKNHKSPLASNKCLEASLTDICTYYVLRPVPGTLDFQASRELSLQRIALMRASGLRNASNPAPSKCLSFCICLATVKWSRGRQETNGCPARASNSERLGPRSQQLAFSNAIQPPGTASRCGREKRWSGGMFRFLLVRWRKKLTSGTDSFGSLRPFYGVWLGSLGSKCCDKGLAFIFKHCDCRYSVKSRASLDGLQLSGL